MEWRPIESAPKDGTIFLAWQDKWMGYHLVHWDSSEGFFCEGTWCFRDQPTHWMPLPEPPK